MTAPGLIDMTVHLLFYSFLGWLAVVWVKMIYPPMSKGIEAVPPLAGKAITWVVLLLMACNGVLTCAVMLRYGARPAHPEPANSFEIFLDRHYDDAYVERRWPNMIVTGQEAPLPFCSEPYPPAKSAGVTRTGWRTACSKSPFGA